MKTVTREELFGNPQVGDWLVDHLGDTGVLESINPARVSFYRDGEYVGHMPDDFLLSDWIDYGLSGVPESFGRKAEE